MAIQKINLGAPVTGVGGDKYRDAHTKINDNFTEVDSRLSDLQGSSTSQGVEITALKAKDVSQDAAIATKANTSDVNAKNGLQDNAITALQTKDTEQDGAIALRALKTEVDSKNTLQDTAITALQDKDVAQDTDIGLRALKTDVDSKNALQDDAINLRAIKSEVNAKNDLQDTAITAAQSKADAAIPKTDKGAVNGVATLGADGKVTPAQLPDVTPVAWGNITGNIADQLDLSELYYTKAGVDSITQLLFTSLEHVTLNGDYYNTTTTAYPNVNIAAGGALSRSTATFGTAAGKDVGTAAGNVMGVGAFGLGAYSSDNLPTMSNYLPNSFIVTSPTTVGNSNNYALGLQLNGSNQWQVYLTVDVITGDMVIGNRPHPSLALSWGKVWTDKNTPASNLPVASIQAGIGAPKLAYKKLTGVTAIGSNTPHGLDASKILSISCSYLNGVTYWNLTPKWDATEIDIKGISSGYPYKILITYEV